MKVKLEDSNQEVMRMEMKITAKESTMKPMRDYITANQHKVAIIIIALVRMVTMIES